MSTARSRFGIIKEARAILHMVSNMYQEFKTKGLYNNPFVAPSVFQIHDYLIQHQLVVLVTDKNLGCIVALRTWIINKTNSLLLLPLDYEYISYNTAVVLIRNKIKVV